MLYAFLFYVLCAIALVSLPLPELTPDFCAIRADLDFVQQTPFQFLKDIARDNQLSVRDFNLIAVLKSLSFLQVFFNFLLLLPLGLFLNYYFRVSFWVAGLIALATTLTFEVSQLTGLFGLYPCPYRVFDVDDLILNTSGALLGYWLAPLLSFLPNLPSRPHPEVTTVSLFRRAIAFGADWFLANTISQIIFGLLPKTLQAGVGQEKPIVLDLLVYAVWFIGIPLYWQGRTVGKSLVQIQLTGTRKKRVTLIQLCERYGILVFVPILIAAGLDHLIDQQTQAPSEYSVIAAIATISYYVGLLPAALLFTGFLRKDRRGLHELISHTQNALSEKQR